MEKEIKELNRSREKLLLLLSFLEKDHVERIFELIKLSATITDGKNNENRKQ